MSIGYEKIELALFSRKKLVATASRRERVYKRTGEPSVTFCGKGQHIRPLPVADAGRICWRSGRNSAKRTRARNFGYRKRAGDGVSER